MLPLPSRRGLVAFALIALAVGCADEPITTSALDPSDSTPAAGVGYPFIPYSPNPVYSGDFADPYVLPAGTNYYAYSTNAGGLNVPVLVSDDLARWSPVGDALPVLPAWAENRKRLTWAPAVLALDERYVLLYTTRDHRSGRQCIGRAEADSPSGPFADNDSTPFICQAELGGSIDASVVRDSSGEFFVIWKNDGNCCGIPVRLWSQHLSRDAKRLLGRPVELLHADQPWEGSLIEGPTMWQEQGAWHLLYSGNRWNTDHYATGYAVCASPLGPCHKPRSIPLMASDGQIAGPGGAETFTDLQGRRWLAYHAWTAGQIGYSRGGARSLRIDRVGPAETAVLVP